MDYCPSRTEKISNHDSPDRKRRQVDKESVSREVVVPVRVMRQVEIEICLLEENGRYPRKDS